MCLPTESWAARVMRAGRGFRLSQRPNRLKIKNPVCAAVKREAEKDWGKRNGEPLHRLERKLLYRLDGPGGTAPPLELQIL